MSAAIISSTEPVTSPAVSRSSKITRLARVCMSCVERGGERRGSGIVHALCGEGRRVRGRGETVRVWQPGRRIQGCGRVWV